MHIRRNDGILNCQRRLEKCRQTSSALSVADDGLDAAHIELLNGLLSRLGFSNLAWKESRGNGFCFDRITCWCSCAMGLEKLGTLVWVRQVEACSGVALTNKACLRRGAGPVLFKTT